MVKIAVICRSLEVFGGVPKTAVSCIEALNSKSIIPDLYSLSADKRIVKKKFNKNLKYNFKKMFALKRTALYSMLFKELYRIGKKYDYIYDFTNTLPLKTNKGNYFSYIYFPEILLEKRGKYKGLWKFYLLPKKIISRIGLKIAKKSKIDIACLDYFVEKEFRKVYGKKTKIIYPPVELKNFKSRKKKKQVTSVASFTIEKNQLLQVDISKNFPQIKFNICGKATRMPSYFKKVKNISGKMKNVFLYPDTDFKKIKSLLSESLIFIHTSKNEPFGISPVEAMASGCIPLVHNSGGNKETVPFLELRFNNEKQAIEKLKYLLSLNKSHLEKYRKKLQNHIKKFDEEIYKSKLLKYIQEK